MACDICGKVGTPLTDLLAQYQTDEIKAICPACESAANQKSSALLAFALKLRAEWLKRWVAERRIKITKDTPT